MAVLIVLSACRGAHISAPPVLKVERETRKGVEHVRLVPQSTITTDVEIEHTFELPAGATHVTLPLYNGWAKMESLEKDVRGQYRLGHVLPERPYLALPVVHVAGSGWSRAYMIDPLYSALFVVNKERVTIRYVYAGTRVPVSMTETRTLAECNSSSFDDSLESFFRLMLPDVAAGPAWLHDISMVHYDYLSEGGRGWERDLQALAQMLKPEERGKVALCYLAWYDVMGSYCFDHKTGTMMNEWVAWPRTAKFKYTQAELKRRMKVARDLGFRVMLYFGDGLAADDAGPNYREDWAFRDKSGKKVSGWYGHDTLGTNYYMNPAHPEVHRWFLDYMDALLKTYGHDVDGFVWDETFHVRFGTIATEPTTAYGDVAYMRLCRDLAKKVRAFSPQMAFMASDNIGAVGLDIPGYAMMMHGTYQDSHCVPHAWSYGLFPNYRNVLWSCNWAPLRTFPWIQWGVEKFGIPVSSTNGSSQGDVYDDAGPSEWKPWERDRFLALFRSRPKRVRYLMEDPAKVLATSPNKTLRGDDVPDPAPGETRREGKVSMSSGRVEKFWTSAPGEPLPQWMQIDLSRKQAIHRFVVAGPPTPGMFGAFSYRIEAWIGDGWKPIVDHQGVPARWRVHALAEPIVTDRYRIVVTSVAPIDGQARVQALEAWGPEEY